MDIRKLEKLEGEALQYREEALASEEEARHARDEEEWAVHIARAKEAAIGANRAAWYANTDKARQAALDAYQAWQRARSASGKKLEWELWRRANAGAQALAEEARRSAGK